MSIKSIFQHVLAFFGSVPGYIRKYFSHSLEITTRIRKALASGEAIVITNLIPGDWDEDLRKKMLEALDQVLPYLQVVDTCKDKPTTEEMLVCWIGELSKLPQQLQNATLSKLSSLLTAYQDGDKSKESLYDMWGAVMYNQQKYQDLNDAEQAAENATT